ncbi:MAG TPA: hypothetical protein VH438_02815 [Gemmatimonadales bacterium]|jgi:hypothetical protein
MLAQYVIALVGFVAVAQAQSPPLAAARVQPARCAAADSLLGTKRAGTRATLQAVYVPEREESLIFSVPPSELPTTAGIQYTTGLIRLPHRDIGPVPMLELSLRVISDEERRAGTQWFGLMADDSLLGDSLPMAMRRVDAQRLQRAYQVATAPLTPEQTLALARAEHVSGHLSETPFSLSDTELRELRAIVLVGLCGSTRPW